MIRLGNFFFRYRNLIFPFVFALMAAGEWLPVTKQETAQIWLLGAGFAVSLLGQLIRALTIGLDYIRRGGKKKSVYADKLVQTGIFAHCRNPLYLGNMMMITGLGIMSNSLLFFLIGMPFFVLAYWTIILAEEYFLRGKFGEEYLLYCAEVPRLFPRFTGLSKTVVGMRFHWKRLIVKEYQTFYIWGIGALYFLIRYQFADRHLSAGSTTLLDCLYAVAVAWTILFLTAWVLKKRRLLRPD
jgi:protein-S-isoprenylcysteine O-methyltransferase Ste14